jgi:hypothetical protein
VDKAFSFFAEDGLKGPTAPRAVHRPVLRPPGIPAVEIAEFHAAMIASLFFPLYLFLKALSMDFQLSFRAL